MRDAFGVDRGDISKRDETSLLSRDPRAMRAQGHKRDKYDYVYDAGVLGGIAAGAVPAWKMVDRGLPGFVGGTAAMAAGGLAGGAATTPIRRKMARDDARKARARRKIAKALADMPKGLMVLNRYTNGVTARVGGTGSRTGQAVRARAAQRANVGMPDESLSRAMNQMQGQRRQAANASALSRGMSGAAPKPAAPASPAAPATPAAPKAKPMSGRRKAAYIGGGTLAGAGVGGAGYYGYKEWKR